MTGASSSAVAAASGGTQHFVYATHEPLFFSYGTDRSEIQRVLRPLCPPGVALLDVWIIYNRSWLSDHAGITSWPAEDIYQSWHDATRAQLGPSGDLAAVRGRSIVVQPFEERNEEIQYRAYDSHLDGHNVNEATTFDEEDPMWLQEKFKRLAGQPNAHNIAVDPDARRRNRRKYCALRAQGRFSEGDWVFVDGDIVVEAPDESEMWGKTPDIISPNFYYTQVGHEAAFDLQNVSLLRYCCGGCDCQPHAMCSRGHIANPVPVPRGNGSKRQCRECRQWV